MTGIFISHHKHDVDILILWVSEAFAGTNLIVQGYCRIIKAIELTRLYDPAVYVKNRISLRHAANSCRV
jgi:hypothetical protein